MKTAQNMNTLDYAIQAIERDARRNGDLAMVKVCRDALAGVSRARNICCDLLADLEHTCAR